MSELDANWIAVAQVYATLAVASAAKAGSYDEGVFSVESERFRTESRQYNFQAEAALRAAGVQG